MPKFIPLTMLKDTTGIVEFCQDCGEPVFVTRNGKKSAREEVGKTQASSNILK